MTFEPTPTAGVPDRARQPPLVIGFPSGMTAKFKPGDRVDVDIGIHHTEP